MKFRSIIASLITLAFVSTTTFAQQPNPKYDNDLDRAMCVFSYHLKNVKRTTSINKVITIAAPVGAVFLVLATNQFRSDFNISTSTLQRVSSKSVYASESEKVIFKKLLEEQNFFKNELNKFPFELHEINEAGAFLEDYVPDETLSNAIKTMGQSYPKKKLTKYEFQSYAKSNGLLDPIDNWLAQPANKTKVELAIVKKLEQNTINYLKEHGLTESKLSSQIEFLKSARKMTANSAWVAVGITVASLIFSQIYKAKTENIQRFVNWDLVDVRNYFSKHEEEMENLASQAQANDCY